MPDNKKYSIWVAIFLSVISYAFIGYVIKRYETIPLLTIYVGLFLFYLYLVNQNERLSVKQIIGLGILFRILFLFSTPMLSDDFYRFIWDGRLWFNGINPFAELPVFYMNHPELAPNGINQELFQLLNSPTHYTIYPPIPQFINWFAAWIASDSISISTYLIRISHIAAETGTLILLPIILKNQNSNAKNLAWYAFNPLIIIELTGNLHHEALMIFFLVLFIAQWQKEKYNWSAFALAMSVASKLLPLIFLPYLILKLKGKNLVFFSLVFTISLGITFSPLIDSSFIHGMEDSLLLYYQKFEFNAGIYYLFREIGFWITGYNTIAIIGKIFAYLVTGFVLIYSFVANRKNWKLESTFLFISTVFALFSLILHPWYISLVILFCVLANYRFGILWSLLIIGTYAGYSINGFNEVYWIVGIEYAIVILFLVYELWHQSKLKATLKLAP